MICDARPKISVLLPVHNGEAYLRQAIESVQCQSESDWEMVVVIDHCTDRSVALIEQMAAKDARIRIMTMTHAHGIAAALNFGLSACRGTWIARMDADDVSLPERFRHQIDFLQARPDIVAVGCWVLRIDADGDPLGVGRWPLNHAAIVQGLLNGEGGLPHPGAMIRRESLNAVQGYQEHLAYAQDKDLWLRLAEVGHLANLPTVELQYREHVGGVSCRHHDQQRSYLEWAVNSARARRGLPRWEGRPVRNTSPQRETWIKAALRSGNHATAKKHLRAMASERGRTARWWWWRTRASLMSLTKMPLQWNL